MSCDHFLGKRGFPRSGWGEGVAGRVLQRPNGLWVTYPRGTACAPAGCCRTGTGSHRRHTCRVLQGETKQRFRGRRTLGAFLLGCGQIWNWKPQHTRGLWAQPDLPLALTGEGEAGGRKDRWGEEDVRPQRASDGSGSHSLSAYCVPGTVLGTGDGREEGPGALRQRRVLLVPQPICRPVEAHRHHGLLSKQMS